VVSLWLPSGSTDTVVVFVAIVVVVAVVVKLAFQRSFP